MCARPFAVLGTAAPTDSSTAHVRIQSSDRHWSQTAEVSDSGALPEQASEVQTDTRTHTLILKHAVFVLDDRGIPPLWIYTSDMSGAYLYLFVNSVFSIFPLVSKAFRKVKQCVLHMVSFKHLRSETQSILL